MSDLKRRALVGAAWTALSAGSQQILTFIIFAILARSLTPVQFGTVALATLIVDFTNIFARAGLTDVLVYRRTMSRTGLHTAFWLTAVFGIAGTLAIFLMTPLISKLFATPELDEVLSLLSISVVFYAIGVVPEGLLRKRLEYKLLAMRGVISTAVSSIVAFAVLFAGGGVFALVAQRLTLAFLNCALLWIQTSYRPKFQFSWLQTRVQLVAGVWLGSSVLISMSISRAFDFFIGFALGPGALGIYRIASRYFDLICDITARPIAAVALPSFAMLRTDPVAQRRAMLKAIQWIGIIVFPTFIGAGIVAPQAITLLFGSQWLESAPVAQILALTCFSFPILFLGTPIFAALGKPRNLFVVNIFDLLLTIALAATTMRWGLQIVAVGYVIRSFSSVPLFLFLLARDAGIRPSEVIKSMAPSAVSALMMFSSIAAILALQGAREPRHLGDLLWIVPFGAITYSATLLLFPSIRKELATVQTLRRLVGNTR